MTPNRPSSWLMILLHQILHWNIPTNFAYIREASNFTHCEPLFLHDNSPFKCGSEKCKWLWHKKSVISYANFHISQDPFHDDNETESPWCVGYNLTAENIKQHSHFEDCSFI